MTSARQAFAFTPGVINKRPRYLCRACIVIGSQNANKLGGAGGAPRTATPRTDVSHSWISLFCEGGLARYCYYFT